MSRQTQLQDMNEAARRMRNQQQFYTEHGDDAVAAQLGEQAAGLETQVLNALAGQLEPVCPWCFGTDSDEEEHQPVGMAEGAMAVECACGQIYLAQARQVTLWTTRKYPPETAQAARDAADAARPQGIPW